MGWCAAGLQAAARALEGSAESDRHTEQLVRKEFKDGKSQADWQILQNLGNKIVEHQREGEIITLSRLADIAGEDKSLKVIQSAVQNTINDPEYQNKLEYLNAPAPEAMAPRGPAPRSPAPAAAPRISAPGPRIPGLGGSGSTQAVRQPVRQKTDDKGDQGRQTK